MTIGNNVIKLTLVWREEWCGCPHVRWRGAIYALTQDDRRVINALTSTPILARHTIWRKKGDNSARHNRQSLHRLDVRDSSINASGPSMETDAFRPWGNIQEARRAHPGLDRFRWQVTRAVLVAKKVHPIVLSNALHRSVPHILPTYSTSSFYYSVHK